MLIFKSFKRHHAWQPAEESVAAPGPLCLSALDVINQRRSVRDYTLAQPDAATLNRLLAAAVRAPTAMHAEPWAFLIMQNRAALKKLSDRAKVEFNKEAQHLPEAQASHARALIEQPDFNVFYNAGTLIVICTQRSGPFVAADCWLAAQNLMLAARAEGLGTCVIGFAVAALNQPDVKAELRIPPDMTAVAPVIVGTPRGDTPMTSRKAPRILEYI